MKSVSFKIIVSICVTVLASANSLPKHVTVCPKSEGANYANCLLKKIEEYRHFIYRDLPDLSLPSLDPFRIPKLSVKHNRDTVDLNLGIKNAVITGAGNFEIKKLKVDLENLVTEVQLTIKNCYMTSNYVIDGRLLILDMDSEGYFQGNFSDITLRIKSKFKTIDKDGIKYYAVDTFSSKILIGDGNIRLQSSDPDNEGDAKVIENFFNENPRETMDAVNPILVNTSNAIYSKLLNEVLSKVPANRLLPDF